MANKIKEEPNHSDESPPILGSWNKIYFLVFMVLIILIILFYIFSMAFD
ncbi:MAG TPA: hypothetical protein VLN45_00050 [Ignavibacteriaceae bacterium]|nr:hypothetical protein [Ignavibacteriaceae bacterium]